MEFALILPILVMFSAGTIEYSRLIMLTQKLQSGAFILADLTARDKTLATEQLDNIFLAIDNIIQPFDFAADGKAIVTSVGVDAADEADGELAARRRGDARRHERGRRGRQDGDAAGRPRPSSPARRSSRPRSTTDFKPLFGIGLAPRTIRRVVLLQAAPRLPRHAAAVTAPPVGPAPSERIVLAGVLDRDPAQLGEGVDAGLAAEAAVAARPSPRRRASAPRRARSGR